MKKEARKSKTSKSSMPKVSPASKTAGKRISKITARERKSVQAPQEIPLREMRVEESKYYTGAVEPIYQKATISELEHRELPGRYDEDLIVLQVRDPWWAHAYWDVRSSTFERLKKEIGQDFGKARWILRSYDISYIDFNGSNAHRFFDTPVDVDARNWYLNFGSPGTSWCVDLGLLLPDGRFITVVRSNNIFLPLDGPSWVTDEEWMIPDDEFRRLYGLSVGLGPGVTSPVGKLWQERLKKDISSRGIASMASPVKIPKEKGAFWLVVNTELIVYGATEPDAKVTVQGKPITLRKDGTFTLRFALPDGKQVIPVEATSSKIREKRTITPVVTRKTTSNP